MFLLFLKLLEKQNVKKFFFVLCFSVFASFWEIVTTFAIMLFAQTIISEAAPIKYAAKLGFTLQESNALLFVALCFMGVYVLKSCIGFFEACLQSSFAKKCTQAMRLKVLDVYSKMTYAHYTKRNTAQFTSVINVDVCDSFQRGLIYLFHLVSELSVVIVLLVFAFFVRPNFFLCLSFISVIAGLFVKFFFFPKIYDGGKKILHSRNKLYQHTTQFIQNFKDMRVFQKEEMWKKNIMHFSQEEADAEHTQRMLNSVPRFFLESVFAILLGSAMIVIHDISVLGVYVYIGFRLLPSFNRIMNELNHLKHIAARLERLYSECTKTPQQLVLSNPSFSFKKEIVLNDVSFCYENRAVLDHVCLSIQKGDCVGFIGESGSGKSTLIDIITGFLKPTSGEIKIDNTLHVFCHEWLEMIGCVSQTISLVDNTLAYNVALEEPDFVRVEKALKQSQFLFEHLPDGLNTQIGDRGVRLSGGEKQRVAIARALYKNPSLLIFDEATSALDPKTEEKVMDTIYQIKNHYTILMISHRLETLKKCNKIYRIDNKKVFACTKHHD